MKKLLIIAVLISAASQVQANYGQGGSGERMGGGNRSGEQVVCPAGQQIYVGSNHVVSCVKSGTYGATRILNTAGGIQRMPGGNGGGIQSHASIRHACHREGLRYVSSPNGGYCVKKGLLG